ncbi:MAG: hypothetical protein ACI9XO_004082 [Paraglaciecola sp.]|jgi:hypothetical protein
MTNLRERDARGEELRKLLQTWLESGKYAEGFSEAAARKMVSNVADK